MALINTNLDTAVHVLNEGNLVAIPTETVYGLAANALNADAVAKIFEVKNRPSFDPLIIHCASLFEAEKYVTDFPDPLKILAEKFWPGPLTLLLNKTSIIPDIVTSGLQKVAVRVPKHDLTLKLLETLSFPLAAPSANPFGYVSPTNAQHVNTQLGDKIPLILDGGQCEIGLESTIVGLENETIIIYRKGGVTLEEIAAVSDLPIQINDFSNSNPAAPGMLKKHYSPNKNIIILEEKLNLIQPKTGFLGL